MKYAAENLLFRPAANPNDPSQIPYYLNVLAGSAPSLANQEDPRHAWVKQTYKTMDDRLALY